MSNRVPTAAARRNFADLVKRSARGERIKLTRYNKTLAILIPKEDLSTLEECENEPAPTPARRRRRSSAG
jgi:prevent-host-death family protein